MTAAVLTSQGLVVVSLLITVALLISLCILIAVQFSKALSHVLSHADSIHQRAMAHEQKLLDRLQAPDFATFKVHESAEGEEGSVEEMSPSRRAGDRPWTTSLGPVQDSPLQAEDVEPWIPPEKEGVLGADR